MVDMLKDQVAIISGGSSGMGEAISKLFAREGAKVVVVDIRPDKAEKVVADIKAEGGEAYFFGATDVTKKEQIEAVAAKVNEMFGRIDILATFAGKTFDANSGLTDDEILTKTTEVNLYGTYHTCFAVLPYMKARRSGKIIICSSNGAFNPTAPAYEYHMAKGACESLTVNLAMDYARFGIRVNCVKPGPIKTAFWEELIKDEEAREKMFKGIGEVEVPLGRMGVPEDVAGPVLFFASDLSQFITGLCLYVAGGMGYVLSYGQSLIAHDDVSRCAQ